MPLILEEDKIKTSNNKVIVTKLLFSTDFYFIFLFFCVVELHIYFCRNKTCLTLNCMWLVCHCNLHSSFLFSFFFISGKLRFYGHFQLALPAVVSKRARVHDCIQKTKISGCGDCIVAGISRLISLHRYSSGTWVLRFYSISKGRLQTNSNVTAKSLTLNSGL